MLNSNLQSGTNEDDHRPWWKDLHYILYFLRSQCFRHHDYLSYVPITQLGWVAGWSIQISSFARSLFDATITIKRTKPYTSNTQLVLSTTRRRRKKLAIFLNWPSSAKILVHESTTQWSSSFTSLSPFVGRPVSVTSITLSPCVYLLSVVYLTTNFI